MTRGDSQLKQRTARGLVWGGIGSGGMQLLNLLFGIFLSRLLSPADYGTVGALTIFSATAGVLAESGFTLAIVNKKHVSDRDYDTVFWFNLAIGLTLYAGLYAAAPLIAGFYREPVMVPLARFLFLGFLFGAVSVAPTAAFYRNLRVKERTKFQLTAVAASGTAGVICAWQGWGYWGIALQTVLYSGVNALLLWVNSPWRPSLRFSMEALRELLPFSVRQLLTSLFTHINNNFFSVLLGRFYGMVPTGYYTQGSKWTFMGFSTVNGMLNSVSQPVMRQATDDPVRLRRVFVKLMRFTSMVSFPAMFGLAVTSRELIVLAIGAKWLPAVEVMRILCVGGAFMPVGTVYASLFNSIGRPGIYMWNTIALGLLQLLCVCGSYRLGLTAMLWIYTAVNIGWLAIWQAQARRHTGITALQALGAVLPYLGAAALVMGGVAWAVAPVGLLVWALLLKIALGATLYVVLMRLVDPVMLGEALDFVLKRKNERQ